LKTHLKKHGFQIPFSRIEKKTPVFSSWGHDLLLIVSKNIESVALARLICQVNFRIGNPNPLKLVHPVRQLSKLQLGQPGFHAAMAFVVVSTFNDPKSALIHPKIPE